MTDWTALPPPSFQKDSNAPASALSLPVGAVSERLVGRKVRVYGRVVSYDPKTAILVMADPAATQLMGEASSIPVPTLSVDVRVVTAGTSTAASNTLQPETGSKKGLKISLLPGVGVGVVGWVERAERVSRELASSAYLAPPPIVVSAIWLGNSGAILPKEPAAPLLWRGTVDPAVQS